MTPLAVTCGNLPERVDAARELLRNCVLCPRRCGADRLAGALGMCGAGAVATVASAHPHFGEETPLVGTHGSGTIFFSGCNLRCAFCQNADISTRSQPNDAVSAGELASIILGLQALGCHNINFVSPTHFMPQILQAIAIAAADGLRVPLVWNCGGYESLDALRLLDGVVDIYMPDVKYASAQVAAAISGTPADGDASYPAACQAAVREMHRQVGDLQLDERGIAMRGLLVRHLVLPNGLAGTPQVMAFLASLSRDTYVNVMDQYRPCHRAHGDPRISRPITRQEYATAVQAARDAGLWRFA